MFIKRYRRNGRALREGDYVLYEDYKEMLSKEKEMRRRLEKEIRDLQRENNYIKTILHLTREVEHLTMRLKGKENG